MDIKLWCQNSNYSFLNTIDFTKEKLSDIKKLGPGACYYFYYIFKGLGDNEKAAQVLIIGIQEEQGDWQELCHLLLAEHQLAGSQYPEAEQTAAAFPDKYKSSANTGKAAKYYIEALYWQQKDAETLKALDELIKIPEMSSNPEMLLFKAVALYRLGKAGWKESFIRLFLENRSSLLHSRAYRFLENQDALDQFTNVEKSLLQAMHLLNLDKASEAIPLLNTVVIGYEPGQLENSTILYELGLAYLNAAKYTEGAAFFSSLKTQFKGNNLLTTLEMTGRLYRKIKQKIQGLEPLKAVFTVTADPDQKDRTLWYYLDIIYNSLPGQFLKEVTTWAKEWQDAEYFADLLNEEISNLAAQKKWETLWELYTFLKPVGPQSITLRLSYLMSRVIKCGYFSPQQEGKPVNPGQLLEPSLYMQGIDYYCFLSGYTSGKPPLLFTPKAEKTQAAAPVPPNTIEKLILGFYDYGLSAAGIKLALENFKSISRQTIIRTIKEQYFKQEYKQGISLTMKLVYSSTLTFEPADLEYLFPVFYNSDVESRAKKEGFAPLLLYSLIYNESAFDSSVISQAGAVGLTQLLPATAADMAQLLKIKAPDLKAPETNIALGARYLGKMLNSTSGIPKAFMAYNAGLTRLKQWEKDYPDLPLDLFIESIPYEETRRFVQRVLETAVMYGYLYFNQDYTEVIKSFLPDLDKG